MTRPAVQARAAALRAQRVPFVHARVVRAERPTSAKPGDEAVVFADGTIDGFVGGTCAESTVRAQSLALLDSGEPLLLRISASPGPSAEPDPEGTLSVHNPCLSGGALEIFLEPVVPAPRLVVVGESPIASAVASVAAGIGWDVVDGGAGDTSGAAAVVVASHGRDEEDVLLAALENGVPYVGLVASRKRGEAVTGSLDVDPAARARIRTPAGLDIGARTPEEVALAILAEIVSDRRRRSGRPVVSSEPAGATTAVDPVCGMGVPVVEASLHLDHDGNLYWFCGTGCLRAFAAAPAAYLPS